MSDISNINLKAVGSTAKGDSGRERLQLRKGKMTPEIAALITKTVGIPEKDLKFVHISDTQGSLIMLHPREVEGTLELPYQVRKNRGVIIDTERETIVAYGDLLGTSSVQPQLAIVGENLIVNNQIPAEGNPGIRSCIFTRYIPHVNLRVFRWAGKTYIASHNTIDTVANKSRWTDHGMLFSDMLKECGLEDPESLFPKGCMYSPYVHMFNVCHPSLNICSFLKSAPSGFIISRPIRKSWYTQFDYMTKAGIPIGRIPTPEEIGVADEYKGYGKVYGKKIESPMDGPGFYDPNFAPEEYAQVNKFLNSGYFDIPGPYGTGEAVMVSYSDDLGFEDKHMIMSPAFSRRKDCIWKNDPNLYHSCIIHFGMVPVTFENKKNFMMLWPPYPLVSQEIIETANKQGVPAIQVAHLRSLPNEDDLKELSKGVDPLKYMVQQGKAAPLNNLEDALNIVYSNLVYTTAPYYVDLVYRSKTRFAVDVRDLIAFIQGMGFKVPADFPIDTNPGGPNATLTKILNNAISSAESSIRLGQNTYMSKNGVIRHYNNKELMDYYIASTIPMIEGTTLYRLIRAFRLYDKTTSLLITEPNARPRAIVEAAQQKFDNDYPEFIAKASKQEIPLEKTEAPLNDDIYGPSAPTCSWANVVSKPAPRVDEPSNVVHGSTSWAEVSPVTPPTKPRDEPLPDWLSPTVVVPAQVPLPSPARGRGTPSTRGAGLRGRSPRSSSSSGSKA